MPLYKITNPETREVFQMESQKPPSDNEIDAEISRQQSMNQEIEARQNGMPSPRIPSQLNTQDRDVVNLASEINYQREQPQDVTQQKDVGFMDLMGDPSRIMRENIGDPLLTIGSAAVAEPIAGVVGALSLLGTDSKQAQQNIESVRNTISQQPSSQRAQDVVQSIAESTPMQYVSDELNAASEGYGELGADIAKFAGGGMETQALVSSLFSAIPEGLLAVFGLKGVNTLRGSKKVKGLTDDAVNKLEESGIDVNDVSDAGIKKMQSEVNKMAADEIKRSNLFKELNIPTTKSRITQKQTDFLEERRIARDAGTNENNLLQERRSMESAGFQDAVSKLDGGNSSDAGDLIKDALDGRIKGVGKKAKKAYDKLDKLTDGQSIPINGEIILERLQNKVTKALSGRLTKTERADLNDLLVEYGLDADPKRVENWVNSRAKGEGGIPSKSEITPLTLNNIEEFRQALNGMSGFDASSNLKGVAGSLKLGVDDELSLLDKSLPDKLSTAKGVLSAAKRARALFKGKKNLDSVDGLIGRLTRSKPRTPDEPLILGSAVTKKLLGNSADGAIENVNKVVRQLERSGEKGKKALKALQASVAAELLNSGVAITKLPDGTKQWMGNQFAKKFDALNKDNRLDRVFKSNPKDLETLRKIKEAGELSQAPSDVARASGTGDDIINAVKNNPALRAALMADGGVTSAITGAAINKTASAISGRKKKKAVNRALNDSADDNIRIQQVRRLYPNLAPILIVPQLSQDN